MTARQQKQAVLDENQNKLYNATQNILISQMMVERQRGEQGEGLDKLYKYLHCCLSERRSETENELCVCVIGVKTMIVNTEEKSGDNN